MEQTEANDLMRKQEIVKQSQKFPKIEENLSH